MTITISDLAVLGWSSFFASSLSTEERANLLPVRVTAVHRGHLQITGENLDLLVPSQPMPGPEGEGVATIGDWLLYCPDQQRPVRILDRRSRFVRRAAGHGREAQMMAANVDTVFIVSSCNQDFNIARLERYLVLADDAGVMPVIVLTKTDLVDEAADYTARARDLQPGLLVETVNALSPDSVACLVPWCGKGQTVALMGSSGVGKSTIVRTLSGDQEIATGAVRDDDDKGRHTTSGRSMHPLLQGGWLMDLPGMRELQLTDVSDGLDSVFADITDLALACKFSDCAHESEPGCAVQAALASGDLDAERLRRWRKLAAENQHNTSTLAERKGRDKAFSKMAKNAIRSKPRNR